MQAFDALARRLVHPAERLRNLDQQLLQLRGRLAYSLSHNIHAFRSRLERLQVALDSLGPAAVLSRGYSITRDLEGHVVSDAGKLREGDRLLTTLARGSVESEVRGRR